MIEALSFFGVLIGASLAALGLWWYGKRMCAKLDIKWAKEDAEKFPMLNDKDDFKVDQSVENYDW